MCHIVPCFSGCILISVVGECLICLKVDQMFTCPSNVQCSTFICVNTNETFYLSFLLTHPIAYKEHGNIVNIVPNSSLKIKFYLFKLVTFLVF